jgi:ADP-heptose:LPS heptosyltransferase
LPESDSVVNACEKFSIDELKACISKLDLFVAVDTGPIYIAEAFDVPTVDIVGPMDENEQPPRGEKHVVVIPPNHRISELHIMNAREYNAEEALKQTLSVMPEMVFTACEKILS